jgi:hypothetical protein
MTVPFALAMVLVCCLTAGSAGAADYHIQVRTILAANSDQGFDPRLLDLKKDLIALNYMSFQLLDTTGVTLSPGQTGKVKLPGGRLLLLTPVGMAGSKIDMKIAIRKGAASILTTRMRIENHGTVIIGGPGHEAGFLTLAVTANF